MKNKVQCAIYGVIGFLVVSGITYGCGWANGAATIMRSAGSNPKEFKKIAKEWHTNVTVPLNDFKRKHTA